MLKIMSYTLCGAVWQNLNKIWLLWVWYLFYGI